MERILVVEDDEKIAQLERDYLESSRYETALVRDGLQVIPELLERHYDLVLLDVMLPGCSGYDICRRVRDEIDIPILMVTARTESADVIRGLGLGADDYITKPFDPSQLVARVRSHLKRYARLKGVAEKMDRHRSRSSWGRGYRAKDLESQEERRGAEISQPGVPSALLSGGKSQYRIFT